MLYGDSGTEYIFVFFKGVKYLCKKITNTSNIVANIQAIKCRQVHT